MTPLGWTKLALEGVKLAADLFHGRDDSAHERIHRIKTRGAANAANDKRLRELIARDPQAEIDTKREKPPR